MIQSCSCMQPMMHRDNLHCCVPKTMMCPQTSRWVPMTILSPGFLPLHTQVSPWGPHTYLPRQVEVCVVCQADGGCLAALGLVVDGQLPATKGVGHPDLQVTRVAFLTIGAEPEEADTIWEHLGSPENLHGTRNTALVGQEWEHRALPFCPRLG